MTERVSLQFLGATGTVTGSKFLLRIGSKKILIDCGLFQGLKNLRLKNWQDFPVRPDEIDMVILTHAHIDHSGYLPVLTKKGFKGPTYCTEGTAALLKILYPDAAYIQEEEAAYLNRHGFTKHRPAEPLFNKNDAEQALETLAPQPWQCWQEFEGFRFRFHNVSHLLGASFVEIQTQGKTILFSGDVGRSQEPLLFDKAKLPHVDTLILESTYGDRLHPDTNVKESLAHAILETAQKNGVTLIPAFAVGRTQEILYYLHELQSENKIPKIPIYLNSPMAIRATQAYSNFVNDLKLSPEKMTEIVKSVKFVRTAEESQALNHLSEPAIIISASGMLTGGRILHHLKAYGPHAKNSILLVGFQAAGTRGEALLRGKKTLKIHGEHIPINAKVWHIENLSAHADHKEILTWLKTIPNKPNHCYIVHGEPIAADEMRMHIQEELDWLCSVPQYREEIEL